ncbi:DUF4412 domain-containing protein [Algoriphagus aestuariicola]|uniref:DUF4412 domain-containing protein n=1 Tax=Algoriphagus aestuariicola TaxID=1852016 RepID=A0ABS3BP82_9BACT|nr:DUF4412 domain-containing protein [Algoriphagus aestuariicola]MBN7801071.1 DUF4412 domain-containing protein [Algoriphagus aestuariicola]
MKKSVLSILILAGAMVALPSEAQLLKKIQNAAAQGVENATTNRAKNASEKATNDALDGMFGGMMEPAPTETDYTFTGYMVMEVTSTDKKGKTEDPLRMQYLLSSDTEFMGMAFADPKKVNTTTTTIMDTKNQAMVILLEDEGNKSSMAMKLNYDKVQGMVDEEAEKQFEQPDYKITKTGNTKEILGYTCEEYLVETEDGNGQYWVTEEPIDGFSMFSPQSNPMVSSKTIDRYTSMFSNAPKGNFMEMVFTDNDGTVTDMKVVELDTDSPRKYRMSDYPNMMSASDN